MEKAVTHTHLKQQLSRPRQNRGSLQYRRLIPTRTLSVQAVSPSTVIHNPSAARLGHTTTYCNHSLKSLERIKARGIRNEFQECPHHTHGEPLILILRDESLVYRDCELCRRIPDASRPVAKQLNSTCRHGSWRG